MVVILGLTGGLLESLFNDNPAVIATVRIYFWILPISYGLYGVLKQTTIVMSALNKPLRSTMLTLIQVLALYIPLATLGSEIFGLPGIFVAASMSYSIAGIAGYVWLKQTLTESMEYDYLQRIVMTEEIADQPSSLGYWVARLNRYGRNYYNRELSPYNLDNRTLSF